MNKKKKNKKINNFIKLLHFSQISFKMKECSLRLLNLFKINFIQKIMIKSYKKRKYRKEIGIFLQFLYEIPENSKKEADEMQKCLEAI